MNYQTKSGDISVFLFFFLLFTFLAAPCFSQEAIPTVDPIWTSIYNSPDASFEEIQENFQTYWRNRTIEKGHGYKPFKRWEAYMAPRIFPSNDMTLVNNTYFNYMKWEREQRVLVAENAFAGNWTPLGPFTKATGDDTGVGRINMVRFDPTNSQTIFVGAANGGLWKSTNGGGSWATNTDFLEIIGVTDLAINPSNTSIMYLATGDSEGDRSSIGVLKSTNGGTTWNATGLTFSASQNVKISKLIMHPVLSNTLLASTSQGVYRTTDGGVTWAAPTTATTQQFKDMVLKPNDPNTVYATSSTLWRSTDNGVTFSQITSGLPSTDVVRMTAAVTAAAPSTVYLMAGKQSNGGLLGIYKSTDSGLTFNTQFEPDYNATLGTATDNPNILGNNEDGSDAAGQSFYTLALAASPTDPNFLLAGGVSQWASTNGGENWYVSSFWAPDENYQFVHADTHEIVFSADGTKAYSACDGGLAMYTDNASGDGPWTDLSNNLNISQQESIGMSATNPNRTAAGLQDIGTVLNTAVNTWKVIGGGDGEYCFIDYTNDDIIVETGTNGSHSISFDGGTNFTDIVSGIDNTDVEFKSPIQQDPMLPNTFYAGGRKNLYHSSNQGSAWNSRGAPFGNANIIEFKIAPSNNQIIYATDGFNVAKSTDAGVTWSDKSASNQSASVTQIAISNIDPNKVWITCSGYTASEKVYKSTDGGDNWTNISTGLPNIPFNTIAFQNGSNDLVYVGADVGVFHRDNAAASWTSFFTALPRTQIKDLKIFYPTMKLRAATYGRGTWETDAATSTSLPVTLRSFTGVNTGKTNQLSWVTTEETDLAYYEVQRSGNGANFTTMGKVLPLSAGSETERVYGFDDELPITGINYYRLKITDLDGSFEYSRVINLFVDDAQSEVSVFPNPTTNMLRFKGLETVTTDIRVMDALGRTVIIQTVSASDGLNVSRLPNGTYFVEISTASQVPVVKRFVKK
ncbi:T9SS type A sorting domain-containing protein [Neolewinella persica]|uniref:T9SS type A sorting domain-containing protein n=1 Tax=Neolewinella persica TaxID=70998 RepID=UPI0003776A62|nr:T9SS type A sorting domain-containing protein [Neolewinella persica]